MKCYKSLYGKNDRTVNFAGRSVMSVIGFHLTCFIKHLRMNTSLVNKCSSTKATCFPSTGLARSRHNIRPENITVSFVDVKSLGYLSMQIS